MTGHNFGVRDKSIIVGMAESTIWRYIQIAKELPRKVKEKIVIDDDFGAILLPTLVVS